MSSPNYADFYIKVMCHFNISSDGKVEVTGHRLQIFTHTVSSTLAKRSAFDLKGKTQIIQVKIVHHQTINKSFSTSYKSSLFIAIIK